MCIYRDRVNDKTIKTFTYFNNSDYKEILHCNCYKYLIFVAKCFYCSLFSFTLCLFNLNKLFLLFYFETVKYRMKVETQV